MIKFTDDIYDKNTAIHHFFAIPCGLIYGVSMGYLMIIDIGASLLFGGIVLGCLITGKINNTGHYFGLFGLLVVIFLYGIDIPPLVLLIGALAAMDELNDTIRVPGSLKFVFDYRLILKIGILILVILKILELGTLLILLVFDMSYVSMDYLTSKVSNDI